MLTQTAQKLLVTLGFRAVSDSHGRYILYDHGDYMMGTFTKAELEAELISFTTSEYMRELSI